MLDILTFTILLYVTSAAAGLYGTRPIANTVLSAGRLSSVTWINDNTRPSLREMGPMRIDLYAGGDTFIATLAKDVDPTRRSQKVWISPTWGPNGSDYHVRFICEDPPLTIYTADFTLTAMDDTAPFQGVEKAAAQSTNFASSSSTTPLVSTAMYSVSSLRTTSAQSSTSLETRTSSPASTSSSPASTQTNNPYMNKAKTGASSGGPWMRTTVDLERIKFRLVFVLWPMLIGLTMAL